MAKQSGGTVELDSASEVIPVPVSRMVIATKSPGGRVPRPWVARADIGGLDGDPPALRHRIARVQRHIQDRGLELVCIGYRQPNIWAQFDTDVSGRAAGDLQDLDKALVRGGLRG
jgi:hypothetical protein